MGKTRYLFKKIRDTKIYGFAQSDNNTNLLLLKHEKGFIIFQGFPGGASGKKPLVNAEDV